MPRLAFALLALALLARPASAQVPTQAIDELAQAALKQWQAPGLALVIVRDGRVVHLKGYGVKEAGKPDAVTPDTVFPLASCTKSFTALALGMLADEGKLHWDDPVRKHVPFFRLADPLADANVTLRDLVTHRTGLGTHDPLWYRSPWKLEERVRRLAVLEPTRPFRADFQYQTVAFGAAGLAVGRASDGTWQDFVRRRILIPLAMKSARCTFPADAADVASPHRLDSAGKLAVLPRYPLDEPDPAGSLHASARDLANYLRFQLGDGTWQGRRLVSAANLAEPHTPQVALRKEGLARAINPASLFLNYGMGWVVQDYRGKLMVLHGGAIDGFRAQLTLVPEARLGIGILSNRDGGFMSLALSNQLTDLLLGLPAKDWGTYYKDVTDEEARQAEAALEPVRAKVKRSRGPARPLADYAGDYEDEAYGPCRVAVEGGRLVWSREGVRCPLQHVEADDFLGDHWPVEKVSFTFTTDDTGAIDSLRTLDRVFRKKS